MHPQQHLQENKTTNTLTHSAVLKGGSVGGVLGLAAGYAGVMLAARRYHTIRHLTIPMKAFLVTSAGTFMGIIAADNASRNFEVSRNSERLWYENREERLRQQELANMSFSDRAMAFARRERYSIVGVTWIASMIGSFAIVGRSPYLSGAQKIVQARVYAQGLTVLVLVGSAAFEISERRRIRREIEAAKGVEGEKGEAAKGRAVLEEKDEEGDLWKEMVAAEEERLTKNHQSLYEHHEYEAKARPRAPVTKVAAPKKEQPQE